MLHNVPVKKETGTSERSINIRTFFSLTTFVLVSKNLGIEGLDRVAYIGRFDASSYVIVIGNVLPVNYLLGFTFVSAARSSNTKRLIFHVQSSK